MLAQPNIIQKKLYNNFTLQQRRSSEIIIIISQFSFLTMILNIHLILQEKGGKQCH